MTPEQLRVKLMMVEGGANLTMTYRLIDKALDELEKLPSVWARERSPFAIAAMTAHLHPQNRKLIYDYVIKETSRRRQIVKP